MNDGHVTVHDHHAKVCGGEVKERARDQEKWFDANGRIVQVVYVEGEEKREEGQSNEQVGNGERKYRPVGCGVQALNSDDQVNHKSISNNSNNGKRPG